MRSLGRPGFPEDFKAATQLQPRATDLRRMLLLSPDEIVPVPDLSDAASRSVIAANRIEGAKILILHDSFYAQIEQSLRELMGNAELLHIEDNRSQTADAVARAERVVVSSVERSVLNRARSDADLGWLSPVGRWVADGSDITADQCLWDQAIDLPASRLPPPESPPGKIIGATDAVPVIPTFEFVAPSFAGVASCLRIEIEMDLPDVAQVFFDTNDAEQRYLEQRSVRRELGAGVQRVQLVLPASAIGKRVAIGASAGNFQIVSIKAAPAPAQFAPIVIHSKPVVNTAAVFRPQRVVIAEPGRLDTIHVAPHKGDTGRIRPDGAAFEARSISVDRPPVGDGDGVLVRLDGPTARLFSGRHVRIEVTARASPDRGSTQLRMMYSRSGAAESSGWQEMPMTREFTTQTFDYIVPTAPPASVDTIAIWADATGQNLGVDIASIIVTTIDDAPPAQ